MKRVVLTDGSGSWFDAEAAESFSEETRWNGNNHISKATGSQWEHEALYRTKGGLWILNHYSQQGDAETYAIITNSEAAAWLVTNDYEPHTDCKSEYAALELV